jgi:hypothetical protein
MADTPNMSLDLPIIGETLGPEYAEKNNTAFETIDSHSHVPGEGVQVPTAGLNINADLPINGFAVTEANALTLQDVDGTPAELSVYSSGGNLVYRNAAGNPVPITNGDSIAGTPGTIAGLGDGDSSAVFSDLAEDFSWYFDGVNNKHAAFNIGDLRLHPFNGLNAYTNFITLKSPTTLASNYSLTLPTTLPASTSFVQVSAAGQLSFTNTPANPILANLGLAGVPSYTFIGDPNTGMFSSAADTLDWSTGGTRRLSLRTDYLLSTLPFRASTGSAADPSLTFSVDPDTGLWNQTTDTIGFATAGVQRLSLSTTALTSTVGYSGTTGTFSGAVSASTYGNAVATSINLSSGGAYKTKVFSLGSSSSSSPSVSVAHGLTISSIRSMTGVFTYNDGVNTFVEDVGGSAGSSTIFINDANLAIQGTGLPAVSKAFYAVIHYV